MKKYKLLVYITVLLTGVFTFSACDSVDFGDVNEDDDAPKDANTQALLAGAMNAFFTLQDATPTLYVQYQGQSVYTSQQRYSSAPQNWQPYYVGILSNLKKVKEINSADEISDATLTYGAPVNQIGVSELMSVMIWKRVTNSWGPVPYNNALKKGENLTPAYTDQKTIYEDLIKRAKNARDMLDPSKLGPTGDVVYGGDVTMWKKFANSLIMQLSLQLSGTSMSSTAQQEFQAALNNSAGVIDELNEEFWYQHKNQPGMENPFSQYRGADYYLAEPFTAALKGETPQDSAIVHSNTNYDARLNVLANDPSLSGVPYGTANGGVEGADMSGSTSDPGAPLAYMTAAYTYLNRAEAAQRGWTNEVAEDMLREGIMMSYATFDAHYDPGNPNPGVDFGNGRLQSDGSQFANQRLAQATNPSNDISLMQVIFEEKWVAVYPNGFKAWSEWRRSDNVASRSMQNSQGVTIKGYPGLFPAPDATNNGEIPRRYIYPDIESGVNSENYEAALKKLHPQEDNNTSRFWWDAQ